MTLVRQVLDLKHAARCEPGAMPAPSNAAARIGLNYERKVGKQLSALADRNGLNFEPQPWFRFTDRYGTNHCVPDFVLYYPNQGTVLVIEVKYTFVPDAIVKLQGLYVPVIERTNANFKVKPLVICRNLIVGVRQTIDTVREALAVDVGVPVLQWLGHGRIDW